MEVDGKDRYTADHILIATGGKPAVVEYEGGEHTINSDGFFDIEEVPKKVSQYCYINYGLLFVKRSKKFLFIKKFM